LKYFRSPGLNAALLAGTSDIDEPISAEIFSIDRLEQYAATRAEVSLPNP
jgi:hypothetical protein